MILFQSLGLHASDFNRIDAMMRHLQRHEKDFGDNLFSFLDKHYGLQKDQHDKDGKHGTEDHEELPFKHKMCQISTTVQVVLPTLLGIDHLSPSIRKEAHHFVKTQYSFLDQHEIFQPPRLG